MSCRMQRVVWVLLLVFLGANPGIAAEITSIDFKGTSDPNEITIQADGPVTFDKQENQQDKQLILELKGATISKSNSRKIDTSSFNSKVSLISPYQVEGQGNTVRVVVQMRDYVPSDVTQDGNTIRVKVASSGAAPAVAEVPPDPNGETNSAESNPPPPPPDNASPATPAPDALAVQSPQATAPAASETASATDPKNSSLDKFMDSQGNGSFTGKPITLQLRDVDLRDVFRLIGDASGFNIIVGDDVQGKITLSLVNVPWDQALDVIFHSAHLGAERTNNILRIATLAGLTKEKVDELNAKKAMEASTPQVTQIFAINYANLSDMQATLMKFASGAQASTVVTIPGAPAAAGVSSPVSTTSTAIVQLDNRTNSIVVRDFPENIERMKKLIELLDTQTPQVMIEAKIVEATEGFSHTISGGFGLGGTGSTSFYGSFGGGDPLDTLLSTTTGTAIGTGSGAAGAKTGSFGFSPDVSFIPGVQAINAVLQLGEIENQAKIITSPKMVVLNKQRANIVEGQPVLVPIPTTVVPGGTATGGSAVQQANISMGVTPTVTNDGSVLLDLNVERDEPLQLSGGQTGIGARTLTTQVLVDSGNTLVIGGVYVLDKQHSASGMPFLRDIPIIGALFGDSSDTTSRSELFIFITPRIINMKEAGLNT